MTLTTYYPAPSGSYQSMRSTRMCVGQNCHNVATRPDVADNSLYVQGGVKLGTEGTCEVVANVGTLIYDNFANQVKVCQNLGVDGFAFVPIAQEDAGDILVGEVGMPASVQEAYTSIATYFSPALTYTTNYNIKNWAKVDSSHPVYILSRYPAIIRLLISNKVEPLPGNYKIEYGGGTIKFFTGRKFKVSLYQAIGDHWRLIDTQEVVNPNATNGLDFIQDDAAEGTVEIPVRSVEVGFYRATWRISLFLRIEPMAEVLNWSEEIGPQVSTQAQWDSGDDTAIPIIPPKVQLPCFPTMKPTYCGNTAYTASSEYTWSDYKESNRNLKYVDQRASGLIEGVSLRIYRKR